MLQLIRSGIWNSVRTNCPSPVVLPTVLRFSTVTNVEPARLEKTLNNVTLLGRVGNEPQRKGSEDRPVVTFSMATHTNYRYESGEFMQRTDWHRISVFKPNLRESVMNYLKKGQRVHVTGRLSYGEVRGEDGSQRLAASIIADDVIFFQSVEK